MKDGTHLMSVIVDDFRSSITVFFVAMPLCLGISLASGVPVYCGLIAGIIGGIVIPIISKSPLSVCGPAAGLTAICAAAIEIMGLEYFFISVLVAGVFQILLGVFRLGGLTHFIPTAVIKGMLAAIGIILISKQIPLLIGYESPDFWRDELFNLLTFHSGFDQIQGLYAQLSLGAVIVAVSSLLFLIIWKKTLSRRVTFLPSSFVTVIFGSLAALMLTEFLPEAALRPAHFVSIPEDLSLELKIFETKNILNSDVWKFAIIIAFVATLESLLSIEAIDKLDSQNRVTPQNRELIAQGTANSIAGLMGALPITSVIVRSSANAEAGARTKLSAFLHGVWLLLTITLAASLVNKIPYGVLAVILIRTGYNLCKPEMVLATFRQGREQFLPFIVTVGAILFTDLLIGVMIGIFYALYFLIKHTYRAGYTLTVDENGHDRNYRIVLALNVSFLNKKRLQELLDDIPANTKVEIDGTASVYIDHDVLEVFESYRNKARARNIDLITMGIPHVETMELH